MRVSPILALLLVAVSSAGCGGDELSTGFEGVYSIETWTENDGSCDSEGPSVLEQQSQTMFFLRVEEFLFSSYLHAQLCTDLSSCRVRAADPALVVTGGWSFRDGSDADGWTSSTFSNEVVGACVGTLESYSLTSPSDGVLEIRIERTAGVEFPPAPDGCDPELAEAAAEGQPCTYLEVVTATFSDSI
jgi:hypothetical protein